VKYSSVAVGEDRDRQSVVPDEVENSKRLSRAERQTCNSDLIDFGKWVGGKYSYLIQ